MSLENVGVLRRWREGWARRDADAAAACLHDEVEIDFSAARGPFKGVYRGPAEAHRVITVNVFHAQGRTSGIRTGAHVANLWSFRDGLIHRAELFQSKDRALEAVRLSE